MNNQNPNNGLDAEEQVIDLRVYLKIIYKRRLLIAMITLLFVLTSGVFSFFVLSPVYEAKTTLLVTQATDKQQVANQKDDINSIVNAISRVPILTMNTYLGEVSSEALMQRVIEKLNLEERGYTPRALAKQIKATAAKDSYLLDVTVKNGDPQLAVDIANTISREFIGLTTEKNQEMLGRSVQFLQVQLAAIKKEMAAATEKSERDRLQGMLTLLSEGITKTQITRSIDFGNTSLVVISPALAPATKVGPNKKLNMAVALILGLMASMALAFVLEFLDNTIKTPEDVAQYLDLPVLGLIPSADSRARTYYGNH